MSDLGVTAPEVWFEHLLLCEETNYGQGKWRGIYTPIREPGMCSGCCQSWPWMWWMKLS